jgi:GNAT superfamily N-acetyltransferase
MMRGEQCTGKECIRQATPRDIEALVDIYIECFPERVAEVFGGGRRRAFIRDYLLFYLAWDPSSNWVYVKDGTVVGFIMVPCHYSPWKAMMCRAQLFQWIGRFVLGKYGFPSYVLRQFFRGGFAFTADPMIKRLQGKPFIHLIAVKATIEKESAQGLLGIGRQLLRFAIAEQRKQGVRFWWALVQPSGRRFIPIWKRFGFNICPIANGEFLALLGDSDDARRS